MPSPCVLCSSCSPVWPAFSHSYAQTLFVCAQTEWHLSLPGMYCTAGTGREWGKQRGRIELKEGASAFLHHSGTPVTNQPHSSPSLFSLRQVNKMRSNSLRELMPGRTRPGYHLLPQASVSSFTRFIYMCSHHHDSVLFVFCVFIRYVCYCHKLHWHTKIFYQNIS